MAQVFISHTRKDVQSCNTFDTICARVGIKAFRSEFEKIQPPAWKTIKEAMDDSIVLFLLVGKELANSQDSNDPAWQYTQNWIAYEVGLACQMGIDVWVICDNVSINFPVPYINNYFPADLEVKEHFNYLRGVLKNYQEGQTYPYPYHGGGVPNLSITCPYGGCGIGFNLHMPLKHGDRIRCPQCLRYMVFPKGHWLLDATRPQSPTQIPA